jgi:hypothetical protein
VGSGGGTKALLNLTGWTSSNGLLAGNSGCELRASSFMKTNMFWR